MKKSLSSSPSALPPQEAFLLEVELNALTVSRQLQQVGVSLSTITKKMSIRRDLGLTLCQETSTNTAAWVAIARTALDWASQKPTQLR